MFLLGTRRMGVFLSAGVILGIGTLALIAARG